jgi:hypothetical protein
MSRRTEIGSQRHSSSSAREGRRML